MKITNLVVSALILFVVSSPQAYAFENAFTTGGSSPATFSHADQTDLSLQTPDMLAQYMYTNFSIGRTNVRVGAHEATLTRGFLIDDVFSGISIVTPEPTLGIDALSMMWIKNDPDDTPSSFTPKTDVYYLSPSINMGSLSVNPYFIYQVKTAEETTLDKEQTPLLPPARTEKTLPENTYYLGVDLDARINMASAWFTGIYEKGMDAQKPRRAYLFAAGGGVDMGNTGLHGQALYASGKDNTETDTTFFSGTQYGSYDWSTILGGGTRSRGTQATPSADPLSNIMALNFGASHKPVDNLTVKADIWYALLAEPGVDDGTRKKKPDNLGTEIDVTISYEVIDGLNLDVMAAYLITGDAMANEENPMELGTRLSLDF